jgi:tRNA(adenine34) deaminase
MDHLYYMHTAYQQALNAFDDGEVPVGAVIVKNNQIIGKGYNQVEKLSDATAHAEIIAISAASSIAGSWRLTDCTIYVTLEPCIMCLGALLQTRISSIIYGASDPRAGAIDSYYRQELQRSYGYFPSVIPSLMEQECAALLSSFFSKIRKDTNKP